MHTDPRVTHGGRLCLEKLAGVSEAYAKACREGVPCKVLKHGASERYPGLVGKLQEAYNTGAGVEKGINEVQVMLIMHRLASNAQEDGEVPAWEHIKSVV